MDLGNPGRPSVHEGWLSPADIDEVHRRFLAYCEEHELTTAQAATRCGLTESQVMDFRRRHSTGPRIVVAIVARLPLGLAYHPARLSITGK